ncbi:MAG: DAK2 domain-containing protein, partial [Chloroflexi bacterium]
GTNMFLTMRSTVQEADRCRDTSAGAVLAAMSHGALMGARGNSGVILSQIIGGLARATAGEEAIDAARLVAGMEEGSAAAYQGVTTPAEGTILTVIRDASVAARAHLESGDPGIGAILEAAVEGARESVQRTPALLPVLAEAGVVDAGGLGLSLLLEGMLRSLRGEPLDAPDPATQGAVSTNWLAVTEQRHATQDSLYGYCTEVLVASRGLDGDAMRNRINTLGDSVLVVGDDRLLRVHVHTDDPGLVLSHGTSVGSLLQVKVDNIRSQAEQFLQMHEDRTAVPGSAEPGGLSSVAVVAGEGMAAVFRSVGCTRTISGAE